MNDNYDAVYDAVRSRMPQINVSDAMSQIAVNMNCSHAIEMIKEAFQVTAYEMQRPSILMKPKLYLDGNRWCALYGEDTVIGVTGWGDSPAEAFRDFDKNWIAKS